MMVKNGREDYENISVLVFDETVYPISVLLWLVWNHIPMFATLSLL